MAKARIAVIGAGLMGHGIAQVFALAGEAVVRRVLGSSYGGSTGAELGRLVVYLVPWTVASVALTETTLVHAAG